MSHHASLSKSFHSTPSHIPQIDIPIHPPRWYTHKYYPPSLGPFPATNRTLRLCSSSFSTDVILEQFILVHRYVLELSCIMSRGIKISTFGAVWMHILGDQKLTLTPSRDRFTILLCRSLGSLVLLRVCIGRGFDLATGWAFQPCFWEQI